jgi:citrate/tricarballylate utilization protein
VVSGFVSAFAATVAAAIMQDLLGLRPPYPLWSPPVVLGTLGGAALIAGTTGLLLLKWRSDRRPASARMIAGDYGFLATLDLVSVTGMLTLALRSTPVLGVVLVIHLGTLAALFLTMPYGKFVHFVHRCAALVRNGIETRREGSLRPSSARTGTISSPAFIDPPARAGLTVSGDGETHSAPSGSGTADQELPG